jgi:hypothetical protein
MTLPASPSQPPAKNLATALQHDAAVAHYAAAADWLAQVAEVRGGLPADQLNAHRDWLLTELQRPGQRWHEQLPIAVEASARWRQDGVQSARFIIGVSLSAFAGNRRSALENFATALHLPAVVSERLNALLAENQIPSAVQIGLARTASGWSRRLYLERGSMAVHMHALEWHDNDLRERTYALHDPLSLEWLGDVPADVSAAWQALIAERRGHPGLLRRDVEGETVAMHVQMNRGGIHERTPELLHLADALRLPRPPIVAWLAGLPQGAELTVASLGRDGGADKPLQMNVYVAPGQTELPQPGPPPGDLRRTPGTICWQLCGRGGEESRGWLLFALPAQTLSQRHAASSPGVQIWTGSSVPDAARLAARLAELVLPVAPTLEGRMAAAQGPLTQMLFDAGLSIVR